MSAFANKDEGMGCVEGDQEKKKKHQEFTWIGNSKHLYF